MMRVTVEIVPHGDESRAHVIEQVEIANVAAHDNDPDGVRTYLWKPRDRRWTQGNARVVHRRGDGAARLVATVFEALARRSRSAL